jgi:HORMA domain
MNDFIAVILYQIIYYRRLYPSEIFTKTKFLGLEVFKSRNPLLTSYVDKLVDETIKLMDNDLSIHICIGDPVLEKFTVNFKQIGREDGDEGYQRIMILTLLSTLTALSPVQPELPWQVLFECDTKTNSLVQVPDMAVVEGKLRGVKSVDIGSHRVEILVQESILKPRDL